MPTDPSSAWKQEINRRIAEHRSRKAATGEASQVPPAAQSGTSRRAAEAAARVAARYANAPSYGDVLASEARAVVRAAEAASRAAIEAQAAAESMLAGIEAATESQPAPQPALRPGAERLDGMRIEPPVAVALESPFSGGDPFADMVPIGRATEAIEQPIEENPAFAIRWDPELPTLPAQSPVIHASRGNERLGLRIEEWPSGSAQESRGEGEIEVVEPAQPIHANLIQFPRELGATRKVRPRLAEGPLAGSETGMQLSIFEVDPASISTLPAPVETVAMEAVAWAEPQSSEIAIEFDPPEVYALDEIPELPVQQVAAVAAPAYELSPMHRRLLATIVDGALVAGAVMSVAAWALHCGGPLPGVRALELNGALGFVIAITVYEALFLILATATPGMRYAHIKLATLEGQAPTRKQRARRFGAQLLSVLPAGLGIFWSIFDEDRLTWHDRFSLTYPKNTPV